MIFTPAQKKQLRDLRLSFKVFGQLEREKHDPRHWIAAAGAARAALTIIQTAVGIDNSLDPDQAAPLAAAAVAENVQAQIEQWDEIVERDVEITAAQQAVEEIFDELYAQLVDHVESLEHVANLMIKRDQVQALINDLEVHPNQVAETAAQLEEINITGDYDPFVEYDTDR